MWAPFLLINESGLLSWLGSSPNSLEHLKQFGNLLLVLSRLGILYSLELCVEWLSHIQFIGGIGWLGFSFEIITKPPSWKSFSLFLISCGRIFFLGFISKISCTTFRGERKINFLCGKNPPCFLFQIRIQILSEFGFIWNPNSILFHWIIFHNSNFNSNKIMATLFE